MFREAPILPLEQDDEPDDIIEIVDEEKQEKERYENKSNHNISDPNRSRSGRIRRSPKHPDMIPTHLLHLYAQETHLFIFELKPYTQCC